MILIILKCHHRHKILNISHQKNAVKDHIDDYFLYAYKIYMQVKINSFRLTIVIICILSGICRHEGVCSKYKYHQYISDVSYKHYQQNSQINIRKKKAHEINHNYT